MRITIEQPVLDLFPELTVGVVVVRGAKNDASHPEIEQLLRKAESDLQAQGIESIKQHPPIQVWREAHIKFGNKPDRYAPANQALGKRVMKGNPLPCINPLVDLLNVTSIEHLIPIGGEDLRATEGVVRLTRAVGDEQFLELGKETDEPPEPGEVIWRDETGVLCRRFNWREADRTKITETTTDAIIVLETLPPVGRDELQLALETLAERIRKFTGAETILHTLDHETVSATID